MPLFKRSTSQLQIPPVESTRGDDTFSDPPASDSTVVRDKYSRSRGDRNELFSGYNPTKSGSSRFFEGDSIDDEEDPEAIKQRIRYKKQESVKSTQTSIQLARQAVETGNNTLKKLREQSERLGNTEFILDRTKASVARAEDKTEELRKLNRSIFIPAVTFNNDAKHAARDAKVQRRHEDKRAEREKTMLGANMGRSEGWDGREETGSRRIRSTTQRSRFQFEATGSDDEMEDALESNLDEIQGLVRDLKNASITMGEEIGRQDAVITVLEEKTVKVDGRLHINTAKLHRTGGR
ncbi:Protein transporter SEC9 [Mycena venus]|uniref:Protein transporter SEC9 n=1 Tax=Mycena venus TaxID=2733690 RepID=A0A8H7CAQ0_9AGAR|nr:Protein transporter SEC9 [Mycena venus]